jgi:hypothetical protein
MISSVRCAPPDERFKIRGMHSFVSTAEAIIGRPLTPMSYAGVARRSARRCAAVVYCWDGAASGCDRSVETVTLRPGRRTRLPANQLP